MQTWLRVALATVVASVMGCGGDDDGGSRPSDAAARADARATDDDAGIESPDAAPDFDAGFAGVCNPVTQQGCAADEKCSWLVVQADPFLGRTDCVPDGTVEIGGDCVEGPPGETTGYDDCAAGGLCIADICRTICSIDPDSCGDGFACSAYASVFADDPAENIGVCDETCDPVSQDCDDSTSGCYLQLSSGNATCARVAPGAEDLTQGDTCLNSGFICFLNGCAEGYGGFLYAGDGVPRDCTAFCSPVDTYIVDTEGDGTGPLVDGADADGAAPADCSEARIGVPGHQCRFFQSYFIDQYGSYLDYVSAAWGFCVPRGRTHGNCNRFSVEWFYESYNDFIEGGGTPDGWPDQISALCDATPARCAFGCTTVATREALETAYCAVPANMNRPACIDGLARARVRAAMVTGSR